MIITDKNLIGLAVYTKSGKHLGKVTGFEFDTESQSALKYQVRVDNILGGLVHRQGLIIARSQVIFIDKGKMVVDDVVEGEAVLNKKEKLAIQTKEVVGVMSSNKNI